MENINKLKILSLYKRCLKSAQKCPDKMQRNAMIDYVKLSFKRNINIENKNVINELYRKGIEEVESMEMYHRIAKLKKEENDKYNKEFLK